MFVVWVGASSPPCSRSRRSSGAGEAPAGFIARGRALAVVHGPVRELRRGAGRGPRQGAGARRCAARGATVVAKRLAGGRSATRRSTRVPATELAQGRLRARRGRRRRSPATARSIEGVASVDESAITGESAPVIRESGGDRSAVTGGTRVLSDWIVVRVTANPGETFLDRMIALVEGAKRQKTPNEIALDILLAALTIVFLLATATLLPFSVFAVAPSGQGERRHDHGAGRAARVPDPDHDRRPALGDRHRRHGPHDPRQRDRDAPAARSRPRATSTCCCSTRPARSRSATARRPSSCRPPGVHGRGAGRRRAARLARRRDARGPQHRRARQGAPRAARARRRASSARTSSPFTAQTRMSGVDLDGREIRKGAADAHRGVRRGATAASIAADVRTRCAAYRAGRRHAAGRGRGQPRARRRPPQGRRQGRHPRALRRAARAWASAP